MDQALFSFPKWLAAVVATLAFSAAFAATAIVSPTATYKADRAACLDGSSQQERSACLYEAASALAEARRGTVHTAPAQTLADNALLRCQAQPIGAARVDCERMARGEGVVTGTAAAGGQIKSLTTYTVEPVPTPQ